MLHYQKKQESCSTKRTNLLQICTTSLDIKNHSLSKNIAIQLSLGFRTVSLRIHSMTHTFLSKESFLNSFGPPARTRCAVEVRAPCLRWRCGAPGQARHRLPENQTTTTRSKNATSLHHPMHAPSVHILTTSFNQSRRH